MARRTCHAVDVTEIYVHWYAGRSENEPVFLTGLVILK